jgi:hypothetical protein
VGEVGVLSGGEFAAKFSSTEVAEY